MPGFPKGLPTSRYILIVVLRLQVTMPFRKPAVIMSPKSLLRHPMARSPVQDFLPGTHFKRLIPDDVEHHGNVQRLVFCTGEWDYLKRCNTECC